MTNWRVLCDQLAVFCENVNNLSNTIKDLADDKPKQDHYAPPAAYNYDDLTMLHDKKKFFNNFSMFLSSTAKVIRKTRYERMTFYATVCLRNTNARRVEKTCLWR